MGLLNLVIRKGKMGEYLSPEDNVAKMKGATIKLIQIMKILVFAAFAISLCTTACTTSRIMHSWKSDTGTPKKFNKILVVGIKETAELSTREKMENHLVGDLTDLGYNAVSSIMEYGPKAFRNLEEENVIDKVKNSGFDAVITIVLLDKSKERYYVPGHVYYSPYVIYHRRFWGYYVTMYDRIYTPGYYATETKYFWESNLYDVSTEELLYSVQTESFGPANVEGLAHEYGKLIVNDMVNKKVLQKKESLAERKP